jgi:NAD(P)-dependent dehydrogenase (short-subunit alcohol dehydrogenase family)
VFRLVNKSTWTIKTIGSAILVTSGGSGLGRELARRFHNLENTVILAGRRMAALKETIAARTHRIPLDVDDADPVARLFLQRFLSGRRVRSRGHHVQRGRTWPDAHSQSEGDAAVSIQEAEIGLRSIKREEVPEDIVGAVFFLASPDGNFVTGQSIVVDGGNTIL